MVIYELEYHFKSKNNWPNQAWYDRLYFQHREDAVKKLAELWPEYKSAKYYETSFSIGWGTENSGWVESDGQRHWEYQDDWSGSIREIVVN